MAYTFQKNEYSTFKFPKNLSEEKLTLAGISATASADTVIAGIQGFLNIVNKENEWDALDGVRVVNEEVEEDEENV